MMLQSENAITWTLYLEHRVQGVAVVFQQEGFETRPEVFIALVESGDGDHTW